MYPIYMCSVVYAVFPVAKENISSILYALIDTHVAAKKVTSKQIH